MVSTFLRRVNIGGGHVGEQKKSCVPKKFHGCWQHANEDDLFLTEFRLLTNVWRKGVYPESKCLWRVWVQLYAFKALWAVYSTWGREHHAEKKKKKKKEIEKGGGGILGRKREHWVQEAGGSDPTPPPPSPLHNISTFQTPRAFNSC